MTIKFKIKNIEVEMTLEEARELRKSLGELFAEKVVVREREVVKENVYIPIYSPPVVINPVVDQWPRRYGPFWYDNGPQITCAENPNDATVCLASAN